MSSISDASKGRSKIDGDLRACLQVAETALSQLGAYKILCHRRLFCSQRTLVYFCDITCVMILYVDLVDFAAREEEIAVLVRSILWLLKISG